MCIINVHYILHYWNMHVGIICNHNWKKKIVVELWKDPVHYLDQWWVLLGQFEGSPRFIYLFTYTEQFWEHFII